MNKRMGGYGLSQKLILSAVMAFFLSALLSLALRGMLNQLIHAHCEQPNVVYRHLKQRADSLQEYVERHHISLSGIGALEGWIEGQELTEITVCQNDTVLYSSNSMLPSRFLQEGEKDGDSPWYKGYPLTFCDGRATVFINDLFEHRYMDYGTLVTLFAFFLCFIVTMVLLIRKKVAYIHTLEREIKILEGGDLSYVITVRGNDELASLAQEMDEMRKAFVAREQYTERVHAATNHLMTRISHDLRTPLTALIGYLDVLEGEKTPPGDSPYLQKCKNRALQIKDLINGLFEYFFVSTEHDQMRFCTCTAREALEGILREHMELLQQLGFTVDSHALQLPSVAMQVDQGMLQRIFDNLLSNLERYADPAYAIGLEGAAVSQELVITMENHIRNIPENPHKTGFGLQNCESMMRLHQGRFVQKQRDGLFIVQLIFPLIE